MIRVSVLCLLSVVSAFPYDPSQYYSDDGGQLYMYSQAQVEGPSRPVRSADTPELENYQAIPQVAYIQLDENDATNVQDEGSSRHVRGIEYPSQFDTNQAGPQVAYIQLDENALRNTRSLVSDQPIRINSKIRYDTMPNELTFGNNAQFDDQIPHVSNLYFTSPQNEHSSQNCKSFSFDNIPFTGRMDTDDSPARSGDSLKDYVKQLIEPSSTKPEPDSKPRMLGFYYMKIQRVPVPKPVDDSETEQKIHQNKNEEKLDLAQANENEMMKYLHQILQQQLSKFVQHQNQEHVVFQQMASSLNIKEVTSQQSNTAPDQLGNEEKKYLIKRLHQEERWLEDSLKKVREFMNELQTDIFDEHSNTDDRPAEGFKLEDAKDMANQSTSSTGSNSSSEPTTVPSVEFETAAFNVDSSNKQTA